MSIDGAYLLFAIDLQTGEIKNRVKLLGGFFSRLVVAGDLLFVGESKGGFYAFDRRDWKAKWETSKHRRLWTGGPFSVMMAAIFMR
jgi:outer membrane protein assembly factor BamB